MARQERQGVRTHLVEQAAQAEADEALRADLVVLGLHRRDDELGDEAVQHRVLLQRLRAEQSVSTSSCAVRRKRERKEDARS